MYGRKTVAKLTVTEWRMTVCRRFIQIPDLEVLVVEAVVLVELVEEAGEVLGPGELVHVEEGLVRGGLLVVLQPRAHRDRQDVVPEPVHEELLSNVVLAVELQTRVREDFTF